MKRIKKVLVICLMAALLFGCSEPAVEGMSGMESSAEGASTEESSTEESSSVSSTVEELPNETSAEWTVMLYLCGTDLESDGEMATYNLTEISQVIPNDQVNFVMETGGTQEWHAEESLGLTISADHLQRWSYGTDGFSLVEELPQDNMASADTLADFVSWGAEKYPAKRYMLVMWDHGGGSVSGLVVDELHGDAIMPLEQLEIALKKADVQLEALVMDACLMATLETAQAVEDSARYLIASEEIVAGAGTSYAQWLQYLYDTPECDGAAVGRFFCDSLQQKYAELGMTSTSSTLTFSVIDLQKIDRVSQAFDEMFEEISQKLAYPKEFFKFAYYTQDAQRYYDETMVDLADMADKLRGKALSSEVAGEVYEAVRDAVVYNIKGDKRSYSNGISFFYNPSASVGALDHYARSCKSAPYLAFLDAANMSWTAPEWVYEQTEKVKDISRADYTVQSQIALTEEGMPQLCITSAPSAVSAVNAYFFQYDEDIDGWITLGGYADVFGDFSEGVFETDFPAEWTTLNGHFCEMDIVEEKQEYILYRAPFSYAGEGAEGDFEFRLAYVYDEALTMDSVKPDANDDVFQGQFEVYGVWDGDTANSLSLPSRKSIELYDYYGMPIVMTRRHVSLDNGSIHVVDTVESEIFTLDEDHVFSGEDLPEGQYAMIFRITDVFGQDIVSDVFSIEWEGDTAQFSCDFVAD